MSESLFKEVKVSVRCLVVGRKEQGDLKEIAWTPLASDNMTLMVRVIKREGLFFFFFFKSSSILRRSNEVQSGHMLSNYYSSQELVHATGQTTYPSTSHTCLIRITTCQGKTSTQVALSV